MLAGNGVELELTDAALISSHRSAMIRIRCTSCKKGYSEIFTQRSIEKLLAQEVDRSKAIIVDAQGDGVSFP